MNRETTNLFFYHRSADAASGSSCRIVATFFFVVMLAGLWQATRLPIQVILAKSSIGESGRSLMLLDSLRAIDPAAKSFELFFYHSRVRGQPAFFLAPSDNASAWTILDEFFKVRGCFRDDLIFVPQMNIPFVDRDGDGFCETRMAVAGGIHGELVFAAVLRVKETSLELVGCMQADSPQSKFPDCEVSWSRNTTETMQSLNFVERLPSLSFGLVPASSGPRVAARFEWTRPGGVLKQALDQGAATVDCFPGDRPIPLPDGVNIREFLEDQYPHSGKRDVRKVDW